MISGALFLFFFFKRCERPHEHPQRTTKDGIRFSYGIGGKSVTLVFATFI